MRTYINIGGLQFRTDSADHYSHVVMLALNKDPLRPVEPTKEQLALLAADQKEFQIEKFRVERKQFAHWEVAGRFRLKPGKWAESEDEANAFAAAYREAKEGESPKYSEVVVLPVSGVDENA